MEMPSKRRLALLFGAGFILALLEPLILLALGNDLGGAFWPMAKRSLEWTYFLREFHSLIFAFFLIAIPFSYYRSSKASNLEKVIAVGLTGVIFGLLLIFTLLNLAYYRDAFLLLPTTYGFIILCNVLIIRGIPDNPFKESKDKISNFAHIILVLLAVWLISPGITAMAGLSPSPPKLQMEDGMYAVEINSYEYPMPEEVSSIQGDYEEDVVFSVYLALPKNHDGEMPLAIILHGFANPFFESYVDWVETLASRGTAVAFIQYPSDVMPPGYDTFELHEEDGMSNHPYHIPRAVAITAALEFMITLLPENVDHDYLLVGGHSLGAGYSLLALDWALERNWGNQALFVSLEAPYARPVQEHLQINTSRIPENFLAHIAVSEDDMSVSECFGVHHQVLLGNGALFIEVPSDRYGFPRMVASHYLQATEAHDDLADWGFYRRVATQSNWLVASLQGDEVSESDFRNQLLDSDELRYMGEWSDGKSVKQLRTYANAITSNDFDHCQDWIGS
ncbi:MAG TPA: rhomboid family intramembrane serine protease [Candidatus Poseidoniales archaeon]|jgi:hypothetical protein|nr:rhomboid family intramembrane serine protease [Candidatus Poseidoniaceae archaeon]DAC38932.1 MAG TPA: rhomboid family intramembrane serine protease [Candidatus Poseidoniales archaeon]HIH57862.1 rhomboid family intramembrane serine protease [Candidatus Poseidoniaceae archaeon]|tara:strand:- start:3383 stop:4903 length:1521 start_codon:yes stop_codon:yes gene_type:complete